MEQELLAGSLEACTLMAGHKKDCYKVNGVNRRRRCLLLPELDKCGLNCHNKCLAIPTERNDVLVWECTRAAAKIIKGYLSTQETK